MPIYEYACQSCEHVFDALQKMNAEPLQDCPECGEPTLKKLLSAPNFRLKGGGWYETDFKKDNQRNLADGAKSTSSGGEGDGKGKDKDKTKTKSDDSGSKSKSSTAVTGKAD